MRYPKPIPVYREQKPNMRFLKAIRKWLKVRKLKPSAFLVSKPNLIMVILKNPSGESIICFYTQNPGMLNWVGPTVYYDITALPKTLRHNAENTFTNWIAQTHIHDI